MNKYYFEILHQNGEWEEITFNNQDDLNGYIDWVCSQESPLYMSYKRKEANND